MSGPRMNYSRYVDSLKRTPMTPFKEPTATIDFSGLVKFAKLHGKKVTELSEAEKAQFVKTK